MGVGGSESSYFGAGLRVTRDPDGVRAKSPVCDATVELVCLAVEVSDANGSPSLGSLRGGALAFELITFISYDVRSFTRDSSGTDVEPRVRPVTPAPPTDADAEALGRV